MWQCDNKQCDNKQCGNVRIIHHHINTLAHYLLAH